MFIGINAVFLMSMFVYNILLMSMADYNILNSLHAGSLNIGLHVVINVPGKPINRLLECACNAVTIYAGKVPQNPYIDLTTPLCNRKNCL